MKLSDDLNLEVRRYYQQFLKEVLPAIEQAFNESVKDSRKNLVEQCYFQAASFSSWRQLLLIDNKDNCKEIYNEIQADLSASISSALTGNYRLSLMSIRSFIELSNLFSYYYFHPIEYGWWLRGNHVIKFSELNQKYLKGYQQLDTHRINTNIYNEWKKVSKYVHAEFKSYMESSDTLPLLPRYQKGKLGQWITHFKAATLYINQLFYVVFQNFYFDSFSKIELHTPCEIIKHNLNEDLFSAIQNER